MMTHSSPAFSNIVHSRKSKLNKSTTEDHSDNSVCGDEDPNAIIIHKPVKRTYPSTTKQLLSGNSVSSVNVVSKNGYLFIRRNLLEPNKEVNVDTTTSQSTSCLVP